VDSAFLVCGLPVYLFFVNGGCGGVGCGEWGKNKWDLAVSRGTFVF